MNDFDCVILYDPNPALWPDAFPQMLSDFVGKAGGGLIYVAGERFTKDFFDRPDDPSSAWIPLLPVVSEPGLFRTDVTVQLSAKNAWKLEITPEGHNDPIFQFSDNPEENDRMLSGLPGMFWHYPVTRAKAGATVLARHADPRMRNEYGNHVLLATQLVGPGPQLFRRLRFDVSLALRRRANIRRLLGPHDRSRRPLEATWRAVSVFAFDRSSQLSPRLVGDSHRPIREP